MYVCLCNGFTDRDVKECARRGVSRVSQVYRALGHRPRCCKCVQSIRDALDDVRHEHKPDSCHRDV